jgi:hypothetical protein
MSDEKLEKFKENYYDDRPDKSEWFLEVRERAKSLSRNNVEHYAPHKAALALFLLSQGARITEISKKTGIGRDVIRGLEWRHNDTLETKRKEFSMRYAIAAQEYTDFCLNAPLSYLTIQTALPRFLQRSWQSRLES